jgi:hypothetical protein
MLRFRTLVLALLLATFTVLGCGGSGRQGVNSDKDRPKPSTPPG